MGILYIVATPIGNLEDITIRAIKTLFNVDYIACEDTRNTGQLLQYLKQKYSQFYSSREGVSATESRSSRLRSNNIPQLISYYDEIEFKRVPEIIGLLEQDKNVALVSDSGTPLISDPGFKLLQECIKRGIKVVSIPGATSLITALTSSGLSTNNFFFIGYLPSTQNKRQKILSQLQHRYPSSNTNVVRETYPTIIFFETPHRLKESLEDLKEVFGDIEIVICRELTKVHEEIWRGTISEAINKDFKGEIIILISCNLIKS